MIDENTLFNLYSYVQRDDVGVAGCKLLYSDDDSLTDKIEKVCKEIYHAGTITYTDLAKEKIAMIKRLDREDLPICIAKTQ